MDRLGAHLLLQFFHHGASRLEFPARTSYTPVNDERRSTPALLHDHHMAVTTSQTSTIDQKDPARQQGVVDQNRHVRFSKSMQTFDVDRSEEAVVVAENPF